VKEKTDSFEKRKKKQTVLKRERKTDGFEK
jgi:hypothetical protein